MEANNGSVLLACVSGDKIVLVRQPEKWPPIYWKLLGGRIKPGETPEDAVRRECKEESDIDLNGIGLTLLSETPQSGAKGNYIQYLFIASVPPALIARHAKGPVECIDEDGARMESICFTFQQLEHMQNFMPKHRQMLEALRQPARA